MDYQTSLRGPQDRARLCALRYQFSTLFPWHSEYTPSMAEEI